MDFPTRYKKKMKLEYFKGDINQFPTVYVINIKNIWNYWVTFNVCTYMEHNNITCSITGKVLDYTSQIYNILLVCFNCVWHGKKVFEVIWESIQGQVEAHKMRSVFFV